MGPGRACAALLAVLAARVTSAGCPPDCVGGGHNPTTDCLVEFAGVASSTIVGSVIVWLAAPLKGRRPPCAAVSDCVVLRASMRVPNGVFG